MRILKFSAGWCQPCKRLSALLQTMDLSIPVEEVDIERDSETAVEYGVRSIPTLVLLDAYGNQMRRINGSLTKEQIEEFITLSEGK